MTVDDRSRLELHRRLAEVIGAEGADTLMAHLPPVTWQDVATKQDVGALGSDLRAEIATLAGELRAELATLRGELRTMEATLQSRIDQAITQQTWRLATFVGAWGALLVTVVGLIR
jgi:hypothetical protein